MELYKQLYFEIEKTLIKSFDKIQEFKSIFDETFLLTSTKQLKNINQIEKWKNDVRFIHIRMYNRNHKENSKCQLI